uniref:Stabilizer of axonemal microtubules 2 n=1 Tax=Salvator merianae TaxID=96440 RepID=A0A8D0DJ48_SALMN
MKPQCLCQICTCGHHRCPHNLTRIYDDGGESTLMTEYVDKYPGYGNVVPPQSLKPKQEYQTHRGKMEDVTTFKSDYLPYEVASRPFRIQEEYKPIAGDIDLGTTYRRDYNAHKIEPITIAKPEERNYVRRGKMNAVPTYRADYRPWEIQRREPNKVENAYHPPTEKFGNTTTFQDAFVPRELSLQKSFKPTIVTTLSNQPFTGITSHRSDYVPHQLEPKSKISKEEYKPNTNPFEDTTTHRCDFRGLAGELPKSFKPENAKVELKGHFNGITEFRDRFQPWPISLPEARKSKDYVPSSGNMDLNTTTHLDYVPHEISPVALMRPIEKSKRNNAPFQGSTTMRDAFQAWDVYRPEIIRKSQEVPKPSGKFDGITTFRAHYIPHNIVPTQSCKPPKMPLSSPVRFEDETMYRTAYTPKKQEVCPATYHSPPGYVFVSTDSRGHKFFRKVTPDVNKIAQANGNHVPKEIAVLS